MKRSEIKILLIEDDDSLGKAMSEAFKRAGFEIRWVSNPDEALNLVRQIDFKLAIIDCLLPRTNGVDLAIKLKATAGDDLRIIFTSGVYKDKNFTKEAVKKVNASAFLTKPFDLEKLQSIVEDTFGDELEADLPPLWATLTMPQINTPDRLAALEKAESLHGFDLPLVYSLIFGSSLSGQLNVISSDGGVSSLTFHNGKLTNVLLKDKTSYFGVLLVEMGFTSTADVERGLREENKQPLGERLVAAHNLSPHAIAVVRQEQMVIRLSRTVQDTFVDVTFMPCETMASDVTIERERFSQLAWDWIGSKVTPEWLKSFYQRWQEHPIVVHDEDLLRRRTRGLTGLNNLDRLMGLLSPERPLVEIFESGKVDENQLYAFLHFLLLENIAHLGPRRTSKEDSARRIKRIKRMLRELDGKNFFEILAVSPKAGEREINKNYVELAKNFHPDRIEPSAPKELREVTERLFARITEAHETLKDPDRRARYASELHNGSAEKVLQNENFFEQGFSLLQKGKYQKALEVFSKLSSQRQHRGDVNIYLCWAQLKVGAPDQKVEVFLKSINETLLKVPPEERHSAPYFYVKGLFYANLGDFEKAKTNYKHAMVLDPTFVEARRDLALVREKIRKNEGTQLGEFSTVVDMFFGKKRSKN